MELKQIRYFVTIVDYGSLTKAASHLRIAQPVLSLQLSNLEAEYRAQLLVRTPKGVEPTEIGKILYRHGRIMLRQLEEAREEMQSGVRTVTGLVALGLPTTVTVPLAMPLVRAVREQYPGIRMQLFESLSGYLSELLANNRLDYAVLFRDLERVGPDADRCRITGGGRIPPISARPRGERYGWPSGQRNGALPHRRRRALPQTCPPWRSSQSRQARRPCRSTRSQ